MRLMGGLFIFLLSRRTLVRTRLSAKRRRKSAALDGSDHVRAARRNSQGRLPLFSKRQSLSESQPPARPPSRTSSSIAFAIREGRAPVGSNAADRHTQEAGQSAGWTESTRKKKKKKNGGTPPPFVTNKKTQTHTKKINQQTHKIELIKKTTPPFACTREKQR